MKARLSDSGRASGLAHKHCTECPFRAVNCPYEGSGAARGRGLSREVHFTEVQTTGTGLLRDAGQPRFLGGTLPRIGGGRGALGDGGGEGGAASGQIRSILQGRLRARPDLYRGAPGCTGVAALSRRARARALDGEQPPGLALGVHDVGGRPGAPALPGRRPGKGDQGAEAAAPGAACSLRGAGEVPEERVRPPGALPRVEGAGLEEAGRRHAVSRQGEACARPGDRLRPPLDGPKARV